MRGLSGEGAGSAARLQAPARRAVIAAGLSALLLVQGCALKTPSADGTPPAANPVREHPERSAAAQEADRKNRSHTHLELASAYFGSGEANTALDEIQLALAADPNNGPAYNLRGLVYANLGDVKLADESFRRALQIDPKDANALQNYGWYLCQQQQYAQADAYFVQALAVPGYRSSGRTLLARGVCQARAGQTRDAERTLTSAYDLDPGNTSAALNLAEVLYGEGEYERARYYVKRVNAAPETVNAQSLWLAARIEHRLGNREAVDDLGRQLRDRYAQSRELADFERGRFDRE